MTRAEWQALASEWVGDASALLEKQRWGGAYHVAGYAVECALKACLLKQVEADPGLIFEPLGNNCRTHELPKLLILAGLEAAKQAADLANPSLLANWKIVSVWTASPRYNRRKDEKTAREIFKAVVDPKDGVLPWLMTLWT